VIEVTEIVGHVEDPEYAGRVQRLALEGSVERLNIGAGDVARHRMRLATDAGTECLISLPRNAHLRDGAILLINESRAIVARVQSRSWLRLRARDSAAGLRLGHLAGHLHWGVRFEGDELWVGLDEPQGHYMSRLAPLAEEGAVVVIGES
jgi:urease accessory protein